MDDPETDLRCVVNLEFANGAFGSVVLVGDSDAPRRIHNSYFGSQGTLIAEGMPFQVTLVKDGAPTLVTTEKEMKQPPQPVDNFIDAILGRTEVLCTGQDGENVVAVIEAAYRSARTGSTISLARAD